VSCQGTTDCYIVIVVAGIDRLYFLAISQKLRSVVDQFYLFMLKKLADYDANTTSRVDSKSLPDFLDPIKNESSEVIMALSTCMSIVNSTCSYNSKALNA
jgi:hypothetical protein